MNPFEQMFASLAGKIVLGQLRHIVLGFGVWMMQSGLWDKDQAAQGEGAIMILVPLALSAYDKWKAIQDKNNAVLAATRLNSKG